MQEREAFDAPLASPQLVVFALADIETKLQASRAMLQRAARYMDEDYPDAPRHVRHGKTVRDRRVF